MSRLNLRIFFDESGKKDPPSLMGALSIPSSIYDYHDFSALNSELLDGKIKIHYKDYGGYAKSKDTFIQVIEATMKYEKFIKLNIINYKKPPYHCDTTLFNKMVYTKLPERILYGLLRGYGREIDIYAHIDIEYSSEYFSENLHIKVTEQLNTQAIYRGEHFEVVESNLVPKQKEIGLELTDLLLGICRTIIQNNPKGLSNKSNEKNKLVIELLNNTTFYKFLSNMKYYEWVSARELTEISFSDYINTFLSTNLGLVYE